MTRLSLDVLAETAELGRALIDRLPNAGLVVVDRDLRILQLEGDVYADYGPEAAVGRSVAEFVGPVAWSDLGPRYRAALTGQAQSFEYRSRQSDRVWTVRMSAVGDAAEEGSADGVLVLVEEVTDRVAAEERVRESERLQHAVIEVLSEGVVVVGLDGKLVRANEAARKMLGHSLEVAAHDPGWWRRLDARHPDGRLLEFHSPGRSVRRSGHDRRDAPVSVRRGDGVRRTLRLNFRLLRGAEDSTAGLVISFRDVTEQEAAHDRLVTSESRLRDAHELAALASWEWDVREDRVIVRQGLPGELDERLVYGPGIDALLDTILPEDRQAIRLRIEELRAGRTDHELLRYRYRLEGGESAWVETRMRAVRGDDGAIIAICGTTQDVTASHRAAAELADTRDFAQSTMDSLAAHVAVIDEHGEVIATNAAWAHFARENGGRKVQTGLGSNYLAACDAATGDTYASRAAEALRAILEGLLDGFTMEYPCHAPGEERWFVLRADPHRSAGPTRVVVQHTDVSERRRAEDSARMRSRLLDEAGAAVIATDAAGRVTVWSRGAETLYHWSAEEAVGRPVTELTVGPGQEGVARDIMEAVESEGRWEGEFEVRRKDGTTFPAHVRNSVLMDDEGRVSGLVGVSIDLTERNRNERELRSAHDYLQTVANSMGQGMCTLDLEGRVVYMNQAAEQILGWSARDLMSSVLHEVTHFRRADGSAYPIEECPILRTRRDGESVAVGDEVFIRRDGTSVPVDYNSAPFETPEGVRGTVLLFSDVSERKAREARVQHDLEDLAWVGRINDAIEQDRLVLHAQPIIDLATGATVQHELLVRMLDVDGTLIPPGCFLPVAERYGLIRDIDRWVVSRAAALAAQGHAVELNISADSLGDSDFATMVERELQHSGADCSLIVIELTETDLLREEDAGRRFIERVRRLGCRLALDDFGTGYGGFTYLKLLTVDYLKIDIEFVHDLTRNAASRHVVSAVVKLAQSFGQETVAEGVEDAETLDLLRELGVDFAQGYHFGRPAPVEEVLVLGSVTA